VQAAPVASGDLFFNGDDQGDPAHAGRICDFRIYRGLKDLSFAKQLYQQSTRWDLHRVAPMFDGLGSSAVTATLSGDAVGSLLEADIRTGGKEIIITLSGSEFITE
jgi:hypothetical protein